MLDLDRDLAPVREAPEAVGPADDPVLLRHDRRVPGPRPVDGDERPVPSIESAPEESSSDHGREDEPYEDQAEGRGEPDQARIHRRPPTTRTVAIPRRTRYAALARSRRHSAARTRSW